MSREQIFSEVAKLIDTISKEKGIDPGVVTQSMVQGVQQAIRKKYGSYRDFEVSFNEETGEIECFEFKEVVHPKDLEDEEIEIALDQALKLDPDAVVGDSIGIKFPTQELGRIAAHVAKNVITQKVKDAEFEVIAAEFEKRKGEIASGIVRRVDRDAVVVDLGRIEAYMPTKEQIPGETFKPRDRVQGYISEVRQNRRGPQIIISRSDERYLMKLFENEVPEIRENLIQIVSAARDPGLRSKIAVLSNDPLIDPVGSCVGMKGSRVQNIIQELRGEKIDIIPYDADISRYAANALLPAKISRIFMDEERKTLEIIVPDDQLSLAIGRRGQNVRLASKLIGWRIDVLTESVLKAKQGDAVFNLTLIPDVSEAFAMQLYQFGFQTIDDLATIPPKELVGIAEITDLAQAESLVLRAREVVKKYRMKGEPLPRSPFADILDKTQRDAKSQADLRLQQELQKIDNRNSDG